MPLDTPDQPNAFNPLAIQPAEVTLLRQAQRSTVANIRESYHGRYDSFAETIQNAVDAISRRWAEWGGPGSEVPDGDVAERPQVRITIDFTANRVRVADNGSGMEEDQLREALIPNVSDKVGDDSQRGHKGVGTTYLAYGHNILEVETKTPTGVRGYRMLDGLTWARTTPVAEPPLFTPSPPTDSLTDFGRGTTFTVGFGEGTNYGNLGGTGTFYNSLDLWSVIFRTFTAAGFIDLADSPPPWAKELSISLELLGSPAAGVGSIPFKFAYPHEDLPEAEVAELQFLQNTPNAANRYKLLYLKRDYGSLVQLLQPELTALQQEDEEFHQYILESLDSGEVSAYASLGWTNTLYETNWKAAIGQPDAQRLTGINVRGGVLVASVGMPIGETLPHRENYRVLKPEDRRRYFLLVHFNDSYRPDVGRKTIPRDWEPFVGWLEASLLRLLKQYGSRLQVSNDDATHNAASYAQAQQQLQDAQSKLTALAAGAGEVALDGTIPARAPVVEAEVLSLFVSLLSQGYLSGYEILAIPGNETRFDALFNVRMDTPAESLDGLDAKLGVSETMFLNGQFLRTNQWLEVKLRLGSLLDEFGLSDGEPNKKYYELMHLAVCWQANLPPGIAGYSLDPITPETQSARNFPGSTHFLKKDESPHTIEVIELKTLVATIVDSIGLA